MLEEESKALPAHMYRDPAESVRFESEKCGGCKWERSAVSSDAMWCALGTETGKRRKWGVRCGEFKRGNE